MLETQTLTWMAFLMGSSLLLLLFLLTGGRPRRLDGRLAELSSRGGPAPDPLAEFARQTLPKMGGALVPKSEEERNRLQTRLVHAGLYGPQAMALFLGVKVCLIVGPGLLGLVAGAVGLMPTQQAVVLGGVAGGLGMILPNFWLDRRKTSRQTTFRRALPDALDVLVICLEGGGSLPSALRRVAGELRTAHPLLAGELNIVQREIQLGRSAGEALRQFADRADLEELRMLASVILQAERFGASLVKALRVHAETLRMRRVLNAEEMAQKAVVKILFPTILFIMPAMFIVILGPTTALTLETLKNLK
jgi:tight adherence protein C